MTDMIKELIKRPSILIMITGAILLIVGLSSSIEVAGFIILIGNQVIRWGLVATGIFLVLLGNDLEAKYNSPALAGAPQNGAAQVMVTYRDAVKTGFFVSLILVIPPALFGLSSIPFFLFIAFPLCTMGASLSLNYFTQMGLWEGAAIGAFIACLLFIVFVIYTLMHSPLF